MDVLSGLRVSRSGGRHRDRGSAVVDFCLIMVVLVPLVLGIFQVCFVLHVRNTLTSAASEAARQAATADGTPESGSERAHRLIDGSVGSEYANDVRVERTSVEGYPGIEVRIEASVPALGVFGPGIDLTVEGHAVEERLP